MSPAARRLRRIMYVQSLTRWWALLGALLFATFTPLTFTGVWPRFIADLSLPTAIDAGLSNLSMLGMVLLSCAIGWRSLLLARRRRCPKCLYAVEDDGAPMPETCTCPECGLAFSRSDYDQAFRAIRPKPGSPIK